MQNKRFLVGGRPIKVSLVAFRVDVAEHQRPDGLVSRRPGVTFLHPHQLQFVQRDLQRPETVEIGVLNAGIVREDLWIRVVV